MASLSRIAAIPDLTEQVYQRRLYAICDGALTPGARLTQYAASRNPPGAAGPVGKMFGEQV